MPKKPTAGQDWLTQKMKDPEFAREFAKAKAEAEAEEEGDDTVFVLVHKDTWTGDDLIGLFKTFPSAVHAAECLVSAATFYKKVSERCWTIDPDEVDRHESIQIEDWKVQP